MLTNNDESEYKGVQECLIKDPEQESRIKYLSFNIAKRSCW